MKQILFLLTCSAFILSAYSQTITITFDGQIASAGNNAPLDRVLIENLTNNESRELTSIFEINLSQALSLEDNVINNTKGGFQSIYPNPFESDLNINIYSDGIGSTELSIYNLLGQEIASFSKELTLGIHSFEFSANSNGIHFLVMNDNGNTYTQKVVSNNNVNAFVKLTYNGNDIKQNTSKNAFTKNSKLNPLYEIGDILKLTGFSGKMTNTIYLTPRISQNVTFQFSDYFKFEEYLIETSPPSFVDIMFSVTDQKNLGVDYLSGTDFNVLEDGNTISPTETFRCIKKLDEVAYEQKIVIMLDNSASVASVLPQIKSSAISLVNQILNNPVITNQEIAIYSFSSSTTLIQDFTDNVMDIENAINSISFGFPSTNLYGSLIEGLNKFSNNYSLDLIEEGYLIALTDGDDTQGSSTLTQVVAARNQKRVFMLGLGNEVNPENLNQIDNTGTSFSSIASIDDLEAEFEQISLDLIQYANSFYWLNYLSPKRNGGHTLTIGLPTNTNTDIDKQIDGNFSANGFQDALFGVYANINAQNIYGIDEVIFDYQGSPLEPFAIEAVSYWAFNCPNFTWSIADMSVATIEVDPIDSSKATIIPQTTVASGTILTLTDEANNYTKEIVIRVTDQLPIVETLSISNVTNSGANGVGEIIDIGDSNLINKGFCWSINPNPTISDVNSVNKQNVSVFSVNLSDLKSNTTYYARAFATNNFGVSYGNEISFLAPEGLPQIITDSFTNLTAISVRLNGEVTDEGTNNFIKRGICWSNTTFTPTIDNDNLENAGGKGDFFIDVTSLFPNTTYYYRAYAINDLGITYGESLTFQTKTGIPQLSINNITDITNNSAQTSGNTSSNGAEIIEKGTCWSTSINPTLSDNFTTAGPGNGFFTSIINNLQPGTTYYVRNYATTSLGTTFSFERNFTTKDIPNLEQLIITNTSVDSARALSSLSSDGDSVITEIGFCWSLNPNPTIQDNVSFVSDVIINSSFSKVIDGLNDDTTYYIKSFATNQYGTGYSEEQIFSTKSATFIGNIQFTSQNEIDNFALNRYRRITGNLTISNFIDSNAITSLASLSDLTTVEGELNISNNQALQNLNGLENITNLGGLFMRNNNSIVNLFGLRNLNIVNGRFVLFENLNLSNINNLTKLSDINGYITISANGNINSLSLLSNIEQCKGDLTINAEIYDLNDLSNLTSVKGNIMMANCQNLSNLNGLSNLMEVTGETINFFNCNLTRLDAYCGLKPLFTSGAFSGRLTAESISSRPVTIQSIINNDCN
ncbi:T9SS type A sorting domain-containing protein [Algibacter mikhailovii]|uniref:VWFA domain-containing protein n=1 Tax=Algibacter mikhailovii TaxID=425498 RepID=A0A918R092_9FLAO|nr:T9SS type A sorting domain-containing protein [Algibacter mikhailovii]GGZ77018.1 hypothetical protein GCM10007028_12800 [Algibacter mikhailovii]